MTTKIDWSARRRLLAAIGAIAVVGLASGLTLPLVSVRLAEARAAGALIALMAALPALGTMALASLLTPLARRLSLQRLIAMALALSCASLLVLLTPYSTLRWAISRLAMGVAAGALYALGEARILQISEPQSRGRWIGFYAATLTGCQMAGPALLALLGAHDSAPVWIAVVLHGAAFLFVTLGSWKSPASPSGATTLSLGQFCATALPLAIAVVYFAMFDSSMLSLLPLYGLAVGLSERAAVMLATMVLLGDASLQVFVGWAADRFGRSRIHGICGALTCISALSVPLSARWPLMLWVALFVMGGAAGGLYTLAIVQIGDRFAGQALIAANAFVGIMWGLGSISGPLAGSAGMAIAGPQGLLLFAAAGALVFTTVLWLRPSAAVLFR